MRLIALLAALSLALPAAAQTPSPKPAAQAKPSTPANAATAVKRPAPAKKPSKPAPPPAPVVVEEPEPQDIEVERMAVVPMVLRGESKCEFGNLVQVVEHPSLPGRFLLEFRGIKHVLTPQPTTTGVVRLEDKRSGLVWLQVPIKSMLMDGRRGQRLVDNCLHETQAAEVAAMQGAPQQPSALQ